jgi:hypothetical protein
VDGRTGGQKVNFTAKTQRHKKRLLIFNFLRLSALAVKNVMEGFEAAYHKMP